MNNIASLSNVSQAIKNLKKSFVMSLEDELDSQTVKMERRTSFPEQMHQKHSNPTYVSPKHQPEPEVFLFYQISKNSLNSLDYTTSSDDESFSASDSSFKPIKRSISTRNMERRSRRQRREQLLKAAYPKIENF